MNFKEYAKQVRTVPVSKKLEYCQAIFWLHPARLPLGLYSLGGEEATVIKVPEQVQNRYGRIVPVVAISRDAFRDNKTATDIILPPYIMRFTEGQFSGCSSLRNIVIPRGITRIGLKTFSGCTALENVYYEGSEQEWKQIGIVHERHEITFGSKRAGAPVDEVETESRIHIAGNDALFTTSLHFNCCIEELYDGSYDPKTARDVTAELRQVNMQMWEEKQEEEET